MDFLSAFVGSPARAKVLRLFLFNVDEAFTTAEIAKRAQVARAAAQKETSFLKRLGIVKPAEVRRTNEKSGATKKVAGYELDASSQHLRMLQTFVRDSSSIEQDSITARLRPAGRLKLVIASGTFVDDAASRVDLLVVADALNERKLQTALRGIEADLGRELRYAAFVTEEFKYRLTVYDKLIRDILDYPHRVFLDRIGVTN
jgi:hypothetical protein